jgi:excisionase family DNA binding protein
MEGDMVSVAEAARMLGTTKEKIARLVKQGILTSRPSLIDGRQRLIPRSQVEAILSREGRLPAPSEDGHQRPEGERPHPKSWGIYKGPVKIHGRHIDVYLREHWKPDW